MDKRRKLICLDKTILDNLGLKSLPTHFLGLKEELIEIKKQRGFKKWD